MQIVCDYLSEYTITYRISKKIMSLVLNRKSNKCSMNPIKYYFLNKRSLPIVQHVTPLDKLRIIPPYQRSPEELPYQWRTSIYPVVKAVSSRSGYYSIKVEFRFFPVMPTEGPIHIILIKKVSAFRRYMLEGLSLSKVSSL